MHQLAVTHALAWTREFRRQVERLLPRSTS
jgi:hypothetical protein